MSVRGEGFEVRVQGVGIWLRVRVWKVALEGEGGGLESDVCMAHPHPHNQTPGAPNHAA